MKNIFTIMKRELGGYFATPVAYVFIVIFLLLSGAFTFQLSPFFERGQADLRPFFTWHPWLYLFLIPAISMRLWADERKTGSIELLMTLPITMPQAVLGKFLAAWVFAGTALALTFPTWWTVNYLGQPDNGAILAAYIGSFLMAGGFLAVGQCISAITKNQVIAFVVSVMICLLFLLTGIPGVLKVVSQLPTVMITTIASFSFLDHFDAISRGVIDMRDLIFFGSVIALFLFVNGLIIDWRKAN